MIVLAVIGGIVVVSVALAAVYDRRARRRGWRVGVSADAALRNRTDVSATSMEPFVHHDEKD